MEAFPEVLIHVEDIVRSVFKLAFGGVHLFEVVQRHIWNFPSDEEVTDHIIRMSDRLRYQLEMVLGFKFQN